MCFSFKSFNFPELNSLVSARTETADPEQIQLDSSMMEKPLSTRSDVPGSIHNPIYRKFWKDTLNSSDFIMKIIDEGYEIPLREEPPSAYSENNRSALNNLDFVKAELDRWCELGVIEEVKEKPYIVLPLSLVHSNKPRLVVDASRDLNPYVIDRAVKLTTLQKENEGVKEGSFASTSDLDSGYWHVKLKPSQYKYVGIHFKRGGGDYILRLEGPIFRPKRRSIYLHEIIEAPHHLPYFERH